MGPFTMNQRGSKVVPAEAGGLILTTSLWPKPCAKKYGDLINQLSIVNKDSLHLHIITDCLLLPDRGGICSTSTQHMWCYRGWTMQNVTILAQISPGCRWTTLDCMAMSSTSSPPSSTQPCPSCGFALSTSSVESPSALLDTA